MTKSYSELKQCVINAIYKLDNASEKRAAPHNAGEGKGLFEEWMSAQRVLGGALGEFLDAGFSIVFVEPYVTEETSRTGREHQRIEACDHFELVDPYEQPQPDSE